MPTADKPVAAYEFADGTVKKVDFTSETYGRAFGRLYEVCG